MNNPPPILCRHDQLMPVEALVENPRNPNRHPTSQVELLANVIRANGWRSPIVVSNRSGFIVKGHGRFEAAKLLGLKECPVEFQDYATEAEEWSDMIADNRVAELSIIDNVALTSLLDDFKEQGGALTETGFTEAAFDELRQKVNGAPPAPAPASASALESEGEKCVIGMFAISVTAAEVSKWLENLYATIGRDENALVLEIKRRLSL